MHDEAREDMSGMAEHQREQPDNPHDPRLVGEASHEAGEVDLRLVAGWRLEANLEGFGLALRPDRRRKALHGRIGSFIPVLTDLPGQPDGTEIGEGRHAFP